MRLCSTVLSRSTIFLAAALCWALPLCAETVLYQTGFEPPAYASGPLAAQDGWSGPGVVQSAVAKTGAHALSVSSPAADFSHAERTIGYVAGTRESIVRVSVDMRVTGASGTTWNPVAVFGTNGFITQLTLRQGSVTLGLANTSVGSVAVNANAWNTYEVEMNHATQTVTAWVNGTLIGIGAAAQAPNTFQAIRCGLVSGSNSETAYFDNLSVRSRTRGDAPLTFTTFAGPGDAGGSVDGIGNTARFEYPSGIVADRDDNLYVADSYNSVIRKIAPDGSVTTVAGLAGEYGGTDGPSAIARTGVPQGIARDAAGVVYFTDQALHTVRRVSAAGVVTTLAGSSATAGTADGTATLALFNNPHGVTVTPAGDLYVVDSVNQTIRKVTADGKTTTVAGAARTAGSQDGAGVNARFSRPTFMTADAAGNLYVADTNNHTIRKITPDSVVSTIAGRAGSAGSTDGSAATALFYRPFGLAIDSTGTLFVADSGNHVIRKITSAGVVSTVAGMATVSGIADGTGSSARFTSPTGLTLGSNGVLFITDSQGSIRRVTPSGVVTTFAGIGSPRGAVDGPPASALFENPWAATIDSTGNIYVGDAIVCAIRKITPAGVVSTLAGASACGTADGIGAAARFGQVTGLAVDAQGNVYAADAFNHTIRKITATGVVTTIAGKAGEAGSGDGAGASARFWVPKGIAIGAGGEIYVGDTFNVTIRKISASGFVTTIAGSAGQYGTVDGLGAAARFGEPIALAADSAGNIYVADGSNCTVRKVTAAGVVTTLAGSTCGFADGSATSARFRYLTGIGVDADHTIYIADAGNNSIRRISESAAVTTLTSHTHLPGTADGTGSSARIPVPWSVKTDAAGTVFVMDPANHRILVGREALPDRGSIDQTTAAAGFTRTLSLSPDTATSWQWTIIRRPADSRAQLSSSTSKTPTFTPDKPGLYQFSVRATRLNVVSITTVDLDATGLTRRRPVAR